MPFNPTNNHISTRPHTLIVLLFALGSQYLEYIRGSTLSERLTSLYCFAACYYCVQAQHYPVPAQGSNNFDVVVIVAMGIAAQFLLLLAGSNWQVHVNNFLATVALYVGVARPFERVEDDRTGIAEDTR